MSNIGGRHSFRNLMRGGKRVTAGLGHRSRRCQQHDCQGEALPLPNRLTVAKRHRNAEAISCGAFWSLDILSGRTLYGFSD